MDLRNVTIDLLEGNPIDEELLPIVQKSLTSPPDIKVSEQIQSRIIEVIDDGNKLSDTQRVIFEKQVSRNANLGNVPVAMVDDSLSMLAFYGPELKEIFNGSTSFILHVNGEDLTTLIEQIEEVNPQFVLLDYELRHGITGPQIGAELNKLHIFSIGFSSTKDETVKDAFEKAGAFGTVYKDMGHPEISISKITKIIHDYYSKLYVSEHFPSNSNVRYYTL